MKAQTLLGTFTAARVEHNPAQNVIRAASDPATVEAHRVDAPVIQGAAWDPHEVWLSRVKKPREQRSI